MTMRPFSADLQKQFRDTLQTPGAPEVIDDAQAVIPVAVVAQVNTATSASFTQITDGTDTALITSSGRLLTQQSAVPGDGTVISKFVYQVNTGTTVHTVTSGKTFYCTGVSFITFTTGSAISVAVAGTDALKTCTQATQTPVLMTGGVLFTATSAQVLTIVHSAGAGNGSLCLWGYEI